MDIGKDGRVAIELPDGEVIRRYPVDAAEIMRAKQGAKLCEDCEAAPAAPAKAAKKTRAKRESRPVANPEE